MNKEDVTPVIDKLVLINRTALILDTDAIAYLPVIPDIDLLSRRMLCCINTCLAQWSLSFDIAWHSLHAYFRFCTCSALVCFIFFNFSPNAELQISHTKLRCFRRTVLKCLRSLACGENVAVQRACHKQIGAHVGAPRANPCAYRSVFGRLSRIGGTRETSLPYALSFCDHPASRIIRTHVHTDHMHAISNLCLCAYLGNQSWRVFHSCSRLFYLRHLHRRFSALHCCHCLGVLAFRFIDNELGRSR